MQLPSIAAGLVSTWFWVIGVGVYISFTDHSGWQVGSDLWIERSGIYVSYFHNAVDLLWVAEWKKLIFILLMPAALKTDREYRAWRLAKATTRKGLCRICGYDLRATPDRCPECGAAVEKQSEF